MCGLPLRTLSLRLRHFIPEDAVPILRLNAESSTSHWLSSHVYADLTEARAALGFLIAAYDEPGTPRLGPYVLAVEHADTLELLGHVGFSPLDEEVEVSYAIAETARGQGLGAEALRHACEWVSRAFDLRRLIAITATENLASGRLLERTGFVLERQERRRFQGAQRVVSRYGWREAQNGA